MTLKEMRKAKGISPSHVAKQLGISYRQYNRIEHGEGYLTKERVKILSKLYGVKMSQIAEGVDSNGRTN